MTRFNVEEKPRFLTTTSPGFRWMVTVKRALKEFRIALFQALSVWAA